VRVRVAVLSRDSARTGVSITVGNNASQSNFAKYDLATWEATSVGPTHHVRTHTAIHVKISGG